MSSGITSRPQGKLITTQVKLPDMFDMAPQSLSGRLAALAFYSDHASREASMEAFLALHAFLLAGDRDVLVHDKVCFKTAQGVRELAFDISSNNQLLGACRALDEFSRGYEPDVACAMSALCPPDAVIIDAGANWGPLSIQHALNPAFRGRIHAFEPQSGAFAMLERIVAELGLTDRISPCRYALSDQIGEAVLSQEIWSGNVSLKQGADGERCAVSTLDKLLPGISPNLIKIDVGGFEHKVIAGAREMIARAKPYIVFEDWAHNDKQHFAELAVQGYGFYCLEWYDPFKDALSENPPFVGDDQLLAFHPFSLEDRVRLPKRINVLACAQMPAHLQPK